MSQPTLEDVKKGFAVSDIEAVVITTAAKKYLIKTSTEASFKGAVDEGKETPLRKKNTILALNKTDDIVKGYDVSLTDVLVHPEVLALVEGGTATFEQDTGFTSYSGPVAGQPVTRIPFDLDIYCANLDTSGDPDGYLQFALKQCKGKPTEFALKDGEFFTPNYTVESRPPAGSPMVEITKAAALPEVTPPGP